MRRSPFRPPAAALLLAAMSVAPSIAAMHTHTSPDGWETAVCTCRPATAAESADQSVSPDGWVQDEPRASFRRGAVPLPLTPDWVGTRIRATGGLAWGDADGDGDLDLAVGTYFANQYPPLADYYNFIYLNQDGTLEANPSWISADQKHTGDVQWGDFNGDLRPDLFCANGGSSLHPSQVFYGQAGLIPTTPGWTAATAPWSTDAAVADFDLDGDLDVALSAQGNTANPYRPVYLFRNTGTGLQTSAFWQSSQVGITSAADWGDMDGDMYPELAVSGWVDWQTGVFRNLGTTLDPDFCWTTGHPERTDKGIGWSDVDGDSHLDLAVGGNGDPNWLFHNEGSMLAALPEWSSTEAYHGCQDLVWVDVDGDGDEDLGTIHFSTGHVRIHLNNEGVLSTIADWQYDAASSGSALAFGDVNGDQMPDLAIGVANGPIELFLNTGSAAAMPEEAADLRGSATRLAAWPNPFRGRVQFRLESDQPMREARVEVWNAAGRRIAILRTPESRGANGGTGEFVGAGSRTGGVAVPTARRTWMLSWDPSDVSRSLPAGVYCARAWARTDGGQVVTAVSRVVHLTR